MKNIYLTGFMGTGKTSVGKVLAELLGYRYLDLDEEIVSQNGQTVVELFANFGEARFRDLESAALARIADTGGLVVATGGGAVIASDNRRTMRESGLIVNLTAPREIIRARLADDDTRPLLKGDDPDGRIERLLAEREPFYADADLRIETAGRTVAEIAREIADRVTENV